MAGTATISWSSGIDRYEEDALAFLSATGITDLTIKNAINTLVIAAKTNGWWVLCNAIYPFVGGTSNTCKYNLKDPQDTNGAFRLTYTGCSFASTGISFPAVTDRADSNLVPNSILSEAGWHISFYSRTNSTVNEQDAGWSGTSIRARNTSGQASLWGGAIVNVATANSLRFYMATFLYNSPGGYDGRLYKNGSQITSGINFAWTRDSDNFLVGASSFNNSTQREIAFSTVGSYINSTVQALMYTDIQTFQTSLSRQV